MVRFRTHENEFSNFSLLTQSNNFEIDNNFQTILVDKSFNFDYFLEPIPHTAS